MRQVPYLRPVGPDGTASEPERPVAGKVTLAPGAVLDVGQAEGFLLDLDAEMHTADGPRMAYLLGLAEGHLANLIDVIRAVSS